MTKWDYMVFSRSGGGWSDDRFDGRTPQEKLSDFGNEGWELVSVFYDGGGYHFYMKRPVAEAKKASSKKSAAKS